MAKRKRASVGATVPHVNGAANGASTEDVEAAVKKAAEKLDKGEKEKPEKEKVERPAFDYSTILVDNERNVAHVPIEKLLFDSSWNSRKEKTDGSGEEREKGKLWKEEELELSMLENMREGIPRFLQMPQIQLRHEGPTCVFGFRRGLACFRVVTRLREVEAGKSLSVYGIPKDLEEAYAKTASVLQKRGEKVSSLDWYAVLPLTGDEKADDFRARVNNISENINRENLRPWEEAEAYHLLMEAHPEVSIDDIAHRTGRSKGYVGNLIRMRTKIAPVLWEEYRKKGEAMRLNDLVAACKFPHEEQVEAYNAFAQGKAYQKGGEDGEGEEIESPRRKSKAELLAAWCKQAEKKIADPETTTHRKTFIKGALYALECVKGEARWSLKEE